MVEGMVQKGQSKVNRLSETKIFPFHYSYVFLISVMDLSDISLELSVSHCLLWTYIIPTKPSHSDLVTSYCYLVIFTQRLSKLHTESQNIYIISQHRVSFSITFFIYTSAQYKRTLHVCIVLANTNIVYCRPPSCFTSDSKLRDTLF